MNRIKTPRHTQRRRVEDTRQLLLSAGMLPPGHVTNEERNCAVTDLLANVRHYCDAYGLDYGEIDRVAYGHCVVERGRVQS